jgi:hydrogenase/urease accessory protein HupE
MAGPTLTKEHLGAVATAVAIGLLALSPAAGAHGLGAEDPNRPVIEYLWLGTKHLLAGWDHLLFILGVVLVAGSLWRATKLISLFVLGHSITLFMATMQEWKVSTAFVDVVIALSVVAVAFAGLSRRELNYRLFGTGLFVFGLIHGLGLSTRLQELGVSDDSLVLRVLLFNLGVEIGQAIAVMGFAFLGWLIVETWGRPRPRMRRLSFTTIGTAGLIGAMVLSLPGPGDTVESGEAEVLAAEQAAEPAPEPACRVVEVEAASPPPGGGHPERRFYEPTEAYPELDFGHNLLDGYVIVTYNPQIESGALDQLRAAIEGGEEGTVAGAEPGQTEALVATTLGRELHCDRIDTDALTEFRNEWIAEFTGRS